MVPASAPPARRSPLRAAVLAGAGWAVLTGIRSDANVTPVVRGKAVDAVTGSVVVHADKDLFELKSELPGTVQSCPGLNTAAAFAPLQL